VALRRGDFTMLTQPADRALAFARRDTASADQVIVLANREDEALTTDLAMPTWWPAGALRDRLGGEAVTPAEGRLRVTLAPRTARILVPAQP